MKIFKLRTQKGLILAKMFESKRSDLSDWFFVSDFCGGRKDCPYIGYKAAARIGEMQKEGYLTSMWSDRKTAMGKRLKKYRISDDYVVKNDGKYLLIEKNETTKTKTPDRRRSLQ